MRIGASRRDAMLRVSSDLVICIKYAETRSIASLQLADILIAFQIH
jgi:hypothetical protein